LATDKLQELLESSSSIAALGAAKELLNRTPKAEPEPVRPARGGMNLAEVVELARKCGVDVERSQAVTSPAEAARQDLERERRERLARGSAGQREWEPARGFRFRKRACRS
jgi:hypothetical protein